MFSDASEEHLFEALDLQLWLENEFIIPDTTNVSTIMSSWTRQAGLPIITVERNYVDGTDQVNLRQRRYYNPQPPFDPENSTWWIPYNYATPNHPPSANSRATGWIPQHENSITITIESLTANDYFLLDTHGGGYYRVLYDERNYRLISDEMVRNITQFTVASRSNLLESVTEFTIQEQLTLTTFMDVLRILENDDQYASWNPIESLISAIDNFFSGHENFPIWRVT